MANLHLHAPRHRNCHVDSPLCSLTPHHIEQFYLVTHNLRSYLAALRNPKTYPTRMKIPPFHLLTPKQPGDRVRVPRHPADESRGYYYGTVTSNGKVIWEEFIPYMARVTDTYPAISLDNNQSTNDNT